MLRESLFGTFNISHRTPKIYEIYMTRENVQNIQNRVNRIKYLADETNIYL